VGTDNKTPATFETELGFWWIDSLAIWTAHNFPVLAVSLFSIVEQLSYILQRSVIGGLFAGLLQSQESHA
jgi:hypothetical protein